MKIPNKVKKFYEEIEQVCKKYNYSISHEDQHGAFIIEEFNKSNIDWLKDSSLNLKEDETENNKF